MQPASGEKCVNVNMDIYLEVLISSLISQNNQVCNCMIQQVLMMNQDESSYSSCIDFVEKENEGIILLILPPIKSSGGLMGVWEKLIHFPFLQGQYMSQNMLIQTCCNCFHLGSSSRLVGACNFILNYFG